MANCCPDVPREACVFADCGSVVHTGDMVWVNNHSAGDGGPAEVRLLAVFCRSDMPSFPFLIEWDKDPQTQKSRTARWHRVYRTRDSAADADPTPEIRKLRARLRELEDGMIPA